MNDYAGRLVSYGEGEFEGASFIPKCPRCSRFVKADKKVALTITLDALGRPEKGRPNATCRRCGRVEMPFMGYF